LNCSNAASFVMPAAANQRQAPSHVRFGSFADMPSPKTGCPLQP
jgi:hypothetical protein